MKSSTDIRNVFFGLLAAFLVLIQSVSAVYPSNYDAEQYHDQHPVVQQKAVAQASVADMVPSLIVPTFLFCWLINHVAALVDSTVIRYQTCRLFAINPSSFHPYYVHLSALAP